MMLGREGKNTLFLVLMDADAKRIEKRFRSDVVPVFSKLFGEQHRKAMHASSDPPQTFRTMEYRIHRRHDGKQHLRRADIARRLLTADMLLPSLQRETIGYIS